MNQVHEYDVITTENGKCDHKMAHVCVPFE